MRWNLIPTLSMWVTFSNLLPKNIIWKRKNKVRETWETPQSDDQCNYQ